MLSKSALIEEAEALNRAIQTSETLAEDTLAPCPVIIKGGLLSIEPDDVDEITSTHFDCWCELDDNGEPIPYTDFEWGDSGADMTAETLIEEFSDILRCDLTHLSVGLKLGEFESCNHFFMAVSRIFIDAGYFCYLSDTRFEVYTGDSIRERFSTVELLELLE